MLLLTDIMERKERVFGLKYCMGVSIGPHLTAEQEREQEREQEEAVVVVVRAVAEMVCFGLCYLRGGRLKVIIMNGYVSEYSNGYCNGFNFCLGAELTATTARAPAPAETKFDNNIVGCGFEFGTGAPITTDIIDCFEGNEFGTCVPSITDIINCFEKKKKKETVNVLAQCQQILLIIFVKEKNVDLYPLNMYETEIHGVFSTKCYKLYL